MIIGFTGASATGKSWVAKKLATHLSYEFISSKAAEIAKEIDFDVNKPHTFQQRLNYQYCILMQMNNDLHQKGGSLKDNIILDRTPFDLMTYAAMEDINEYNSIQLEGYFSFCKNVAKIFDLIVLISPDQSELIGTGEYKPGRITTDIVNGDNHRIVYDTTLKIFLSSKEFVDRVLVVPPEIHYEERVKFVKERIKEYERT